MFGKTRKTIEARRRKKEKSVGIELKGEKEMGESEGKKEIREKSKRE